MFLSSKVSSTKCKLMQMQKHFSIMHWQSSSPSTDLEDDLKPGLRNKIQIIDYITSSAWNVSICRLAVFYVINLFPFVF